MPRSSPQALLLIDGYNIVGLWADLRTVRDREGLEPARRQLVETLAGYSAFHGFDTHIVFDSQYRNTGGSRELITPNLSVCYTDSGQTADTYIEKACADFRYDMRKFQQRLIVATSDRAQQLTVVGYGAEWLSAERLRVEVESTIRQVQQRQQKAAKKPAARFLAHALDPIAQQRLANLRLGKQP